MRLFTNNAQTTLAAPVSAVALSIQVATGDGAKFPSPTGGDYFVVTLYKAVSGVESAIEIVKVTARSGDIFTVQRAQEGTVAQVYTTGDFVSLRYTAGPANDAEVHAARVDNPHATTASQVGAEPTITGGTTAQYWRGDKTFADFFTSVRAATLTGLSLATNAAITATDTVLSAFGKLQKQFSDHFGAGGAEHAAATTTVNGFMSSTDKTKLDGIEAGATINAPTVTTVADATNASQFISFHAAQTGTNAIRTDAELVYNPSTNTLTVVNLTATGAATLNGTGNKLTVSGTGSSLSINPATAGAVDNVAIGGTTAAAGAFTSLTASGAVNANGGSLATTQTTFSLVNATATTVNIAGAATSLSLGNTATAAQTFNLGTASTGASTYNFGTGATASATIKVLNLGTGGSTGSTTNLNFGSSNGGTFTVNSPSMSVAGQAVLTRYNLLAQTVSVTGATTLDLAVANYFQGTATANATLSFTNPAASGRAHDFILELTNGGNFTITWPASVKWPGGIAPTLTTNGVDVLSFITDDGGITWRGVLSMKDSK